MSRWIRILHRVEDAVLALLLGAMTLVAAAQILLRNLIDWNLGWGDPLVRLLVLWVGLLGALAASRENRHIAIDLLSHLLPPRLRSATQSLNCLFVAAVCGLVAWHAGRFILDERADATRGLLGLPEWLLHMVVPLGFALIALRYALQAVQRARQSLRQPAPSGQAP
jgi:TRAP-type C4-dicarboxylate transport system permease small subunit